MDEEAGVEDDEVVVAVEGEAEAVDDEEEGHDECWRLLVLRLPLPNLLSVQQLV